MDEYAKLDANDESLARWKASLGITGGGAGAATGPKVPNVQPYHELPHLLQYLQVTVLSLFLTSATLPPGKVISFDLTDAAAVSQLKDNPVNIREGIEYK